MVSVITVNFNGKRYLSDLIESLMQQTLRPSEIIVVDNASTDDSVEFLRRTYPSVKIVRSQKNIGFAGGNNLGAEVASSQLLALINNDTIVASDWLEQLVNIWTTRTKIGEKIGAVSPKIHFLKRFLTFRLRSRVFTAGGGDTRTLGIAVNFSRTAISDVAYNKPIAQSGFYHEERWAEEQVVRWTSGEGVLLLPVEERNDTKPLTLRLSASAPGQQEGMELELECEGVLLGSCCLNKSFTDFEFEIPPGLHRAAKWVINNAGSSCDKYGNTADIGINQLDNGQFDKIVDLDAFCGCSVLIPKSLFVKLGGFNQRFFMYYEDTDLAWRMRKTGLKILFQPLSMVRHVHAGSSGEWSPNFRYYVTRNYYLNGLSNGSVHVFSVLLTRLFYLLLRSALQDKCRNLRHPSSGLIGEMQPAQIEFVALKDAARMTPNIALHCLRLFFKTQSKQ